jgi:hypothetical protein
VERIILPPSLRVCLVRGFWRERGGSIVIFKPLVQFLGGERKGAKSLLVPLFASSQIGFYGGKRNEDVLFIF